MLKMDFLKKFKEEMVAVEKQDRDNLKRLNTVQDMNSRVWKEGLAEIKKTEEQIGALWKEGWVELQEEWARIREESLAKMEDERRARVEEFKKGLSVESPSLELTPIYPPSGESQREIEELKKRVADLEKKQG